MMCPQVLTIAGSDSGGGAGIQADLKTFQELGVFGTSVVTAVTAQNTCGVHGVEAISPELVMQQLDAIGSDFSIAACKTGMLFDATRIETVAAGLKRHAFGQLVVDPVMIAKGGASLLQDTAVDALKTSLFPLATVITPNIPEAEVLTGLTIRSFEDRLEAARRMLAYGVRAVVLKGGHLEGESADDLVMTGSETFVLSASRIQTSDTHGTGCTFSAALTAELAKGRPIVEATVTAKRFIQSAITYGLKIGAGHGPTNHWAYATHGEAGVTLESITTNHR
jgi:hydroxymethylpyrimidine/phosphomethylpyrimidine kinase